MLMQVVLTVGESKRLIAKGVAAHPLVRAALEKGTVVVARGGTNSYVAEELLGERIDQLAFLTGHTVPRGHTRSKRATKPLTEVVLRRGKVVPGAALAQGLAELQAGDVFIKGANALNYDRSPSPRRVAGILLGRADGGTIGAAWPVIAERKAHLVVPVGLEKLVASDIRQTSRLITGSRLEPDPVLGMWVVDEATIVTEIEALELLAGVECHHLASGGIGGAEGSVRVLVSGDEAAIGKAQELLDGLAGEQPFPI